MVMAAVVATMKLDKINNECKINDGTCQLPTGPYLNPLQETRGPSIWGASCNCVRILISKKAHGEATCSCGGSKHSRQFSGLVLGSSQSNSCSCKCIKKPNFDQLKLNKVCGTCGSSCGEMTEEANASSDDQATESVALKRSENGMKE